MPRMTPNGALVETLVCNDVTDVFGIVGCAFMDALHIFPALEKACDTQEQNRTTRHLERYKEYVSG